MKKLLIAALVTATLSSCNSTSKGKQEFETANQLAAANQYQEAINYLTQAVKKAPKNLEYRNALKALKARYESESVAKINSLLAGEMTNNDLADAETIVNSLNDNASAEGLTAPLIARVNEAKEKLYAELSTQYATANQAYEAGNLVQSYQIFKAIESKFENYEDVSLKIKAISKEVNQVNLKQANEAIKADNFAEASRLLNDILTINPNNNIAKALLAKAKSSNTPNYFLVKAKQAAAKASWSEALAFCNKALALQSNNSECLLLSSQAKESLGRENQQNFLAAMNDSRLLEAKMLLQSLATNSTTEKALLEQYTAAFSEKADYTASLYIDDGKYALAWNLFSSIQDVNPTYPELFTKIRQVEDAINKRAKRSIAVFDFNSPADSDDAGVIVANNLISRLFNNASNDITILERENLKSILEEMKLGQIGVVSESTAKEMGRVYGIDYAIMGSVLLYKVDENNAQSTKTIRYQTGEKIADNIDYLNWRAANPKPSRKDLQSAPQAKVMVPEYGQTEYEVTQTKKVGFIQLSFRIVDVLTGENTRVDTIERKLQVEDEANAGVAEAGVNFDPMEIPTDTEILQQLTEEVVESMASDVLRPLQQLETFYFNQGQDREKRSEIESAVEYYTYAIFNERLKSVSSSPITREARTRIDKLLNSHQFRE